MNLLRFENEDNLVKYVLIIYRDQTILDECFNRSRNLGEISVEDIQTICDIIGRNYQRSIDQIHLNTLLTHMTDLSDSISCINNYLAYLLAYYEVNE